jgi:hypothetical protein
MNSVWTQCLTLARQEFYHLSYAVAFMWCFNTQKYCVMLKLDQTLSISSNIYYLYLWKLSKSFLLGFFFLYWDLNSGPSPWVTSPALFCDGFFQDGVSWTICLGWLRTMILLISASWVARMIGVSHWQPASSRLWKPTVHYVICNHPVDHLLVNLSPSLPLPFSSASVNHHSIFFSFFFNGGRVVPGLHSGLHV